MSFRFRLDEACAAARQPGLRRINAIEFTQRAVRAGETLCYYAAFNGTKKYWRILASILTSNLQYSKTITEAIALILTPPLSTRGIIAYLTGLDRREYFERAIMATEHPQLRALQKELAVFRRDRSAIDTDEGKWTAELVDLLVATNVQRMQMKQKWIPAELFLSTHA